MERGDFEVIDSFCSSLKHPYVAMDTEFPGVVARPYGTFRSHTDYQYQVIMCPVFVRLCLISKNFDSLEMTSSSSFLHFFSRL